MDDIAGLGIITSIVISGIGFVFFSYGRKLTRAPQIAGGLILMIFPYFVTSVLGMLAVATAIILLLWFALRMGW